MDYASNGKANAGLTLGVIGTSLAGLLWANGANGGNGLSGILGNRNGNGNQQELIGSLEAQVAELKAMRYTDQVGLELYKNIISQSNIEDAKINANMKEVMAYIVELSKDVALNKQAAYYDNIITNNRIDCCCDKTGMQINFNKQLGELADDNILCYVNSKFVPGNLVMPLSSICPPAAPATSTTTTATTTA